MIRTGEIIFLTSDSCEWRIQDYSNFPVLEAGHDGQRHHSHDTELDSGQPSRTDLQSQQTQPGQSSLPCKHIFKISHSAHLS